MRHAGVLTAMRREEGCADDSCFCTDNWLTDDPVKNFRIFVAPVSKRRLPVKKANPGEFAFCRRDCPTRQALRLVRPARPISRATGSARCWAASWLAPASRYQLVAGSGCGSLQPFLRRSRRQRCGYATKTSFPTWFAGSKPPS